MQTIKTYVKQNYRVKTDHILFKNNLDSEQNNTHKYIFFELIHLMFLKVVKSVSPTNPNTTKKRNAHGSECIKFSIPELYMKTIKYDNEEKYQKQKRRME